MGRGLGINAHITIAGVLGFGHGPLGGGFSPDVRQGYPHNMAEPHWPRALGL
ncbi:hypothetical protein Hanom_Chr04g00360671 [Helianthus anomalus]